jgi:hypothetical protein
VSDEALKRLIRVAEILATDSKDPITKARAEEIIALARIIQENKK